MSISTDYARPVLVNGYSCRNCDDVAEAKKGVDPAKPEAGPYADNARDDVSAVSFGGLLQGLNTSASTPDNPDSQRERPKGGYVDCFA